LELELVLALRDLEEWFRTKNFDESRTKSEAKRCYSFER